MKRGYLFWFYWTKWTTDSHLFHAPMDMSNTAHCEWSFKMGICITLGQPFATFSRQSFIRGEYVQKSNFAIISGLQRHVVTEEGVSQSRFYQIENPAYGVDANCFDISGWKSQRTLKGWSVFLRNTTILQNITVKLMQVLLCPSLEGVGWVHAILPMAQMAKKYTLSNVILVVKNRPHATNVFLHRTAHKIKVGSHIINLFFKWHALLQVGYWEDFLFVTKNNVGLLQPCRYWRWEQQFLRS